MNQQLLERVLRSPRLPSLPAIALEVIELVQQKDVNIRQIAATISNDPALATKILRTVNSSFYAQTQPISTITHALVILGLNSVKTLALSFSLVSNLKQAGAGDFDHVALWKRSLFTAVAARSLGREFGMLQQEEAFLGGLLQDLGVLAMSQALGEAYTNLVAEVGPNHRQLTVLERERLQTDHAEIGAALAEHWKLPPVLAAPIRYHEDCAGCPEELEPMIHCVALGNLVADIFINENGQALEDYNRLATEWFQASPERAQALLASIHKNTVEMHRLFDVPTGPLGDAEEILARANEALQHLSLQAAQKSTELEETNRRLAQEAFTDSLTGAANRRRFNEGILELFDTTRKSRQPVALLFLDTDHFKKFNDTYGHQTGDRVLVELAGMLRKHSPKDALVARYGGEEFAVVVPNADRIVAARLAEKIRQAVATTPITDEEGNLLGITISIGVASYDGTGFERVEQLIKAADQGVYAAKAAGRNCVRVFAPRVAKTAA